MPRRARLDAPNVLQHLMARGHIGPKDLPGQKEPGGISPTAFRYKSIVVEEAPYFLELVRYIHLNPVRARMLSQLSDEEAGESISGLGRLCGFAHASVREAIERAREERDGGC